MFECTWRNFENRFGAIVANLRRHADLLDREAASIHFAAAKEAALKSQEQAEAFEMQKARTELKAVQQWLAVDGVQEARLERLAHHCQSGSCDWVFRNESLSSWMVDNRNRQIVWIRGNPGSGMLALVRCSLLLAGLKIVSGKSVLCSQIIDHLWEQKAFQPAFYFCSYTPTASDSCIDIIRNICAQLLSSYSDTVAYIYRTYVDTFRSTSIRPMKELLREVLSSLGSCRIIIDGLDECGVDQQKDILSAFLGLQDSAAESCKILFSSRNDDSTIKRQLGRRTVINLKGQTDEAIAHYVRFNTDELSQSFEDLDQGMLDRIQQQVCSKAKGTISQVSVQ